MAKTPSLKTQQMQVGGMDCPSCEMKIETRLQKLSGVTETAFDVATGRLTVSYDLQQVSERAIQDCVIKLGYKIVTAKPTRSSSEPDHHNGHKHDDGHDHSHAGHDHAGHNHDDNDEHDHNHGNGEFSLKREGLLIGVVIALFILYSDKNWTFVND